MQCELGHKFEPLAGQDTSHLNAVSKRTVISYLLKQRLRQAFLA